jgi:ABC-2 type transport system ATP-binding protein
MLDLLAFKKSYGNFPVLEIGDLHLDAALYWIRGVNGSGKSTLLRTIAGLLSFDGDVLLDHSISIKKNPIQYRRLVNFAEAEPVFPEFLTGMEMIRLFTTAKHAPAGQENYFIESMKMQPWIDRQLGTYSSGMLKKLSLVLAFMGNPRLILLDEPLITIDHESLQILYRWITEKQARDGTSFFLSSHQEIDRQMIGDFREIQVQEKTLRFNDHVSLTGRHAH